MDNKNMPATACTLKIEHINVGTVGHVDHGISSISKSISMATVNTGDWIDPTPWTPEDHERFKKAIEKVRELNAPQATCGVLNNKQVAAIKRELALIDKNYKKGKTL
jgi:GTPase